MSQSGQMARDSALQSWEWLNVFFSPRIIPHFAFLLPMQHDIMGR